MQDSPKVLENPTIHIVGQIQDVSELSRGDVAAAYAVMLEEQNRKAAKILEDAEMQRNFMITDAQKQAEQILINAGQEAEQMKIIAREEAVEAGYAEGHDRGYKAAKDEMINLIKEANEKAERTVWLAENEIKDSVLKAESKIVEIAMAIASKVIPQHFIDVPQIILPLVRSALEKVRDQRDIVIKVSPDDYELVLMAKKEFQTMLDSDNQLTVSTDQTLTNGNCIIESANGNVDARVSTQMEAVKKAIQEVM
ncbi:MAG: Flagellar assembly protein FliH/Type secretion system HrpE [Firmicutes bacterium]|nr:Flagellar assembly protein FliH/Type secretion system HrpE [Bacillota bacterium]